LVEVSEVVGLRAPKLAPELDDPPLVVGEGVVVREPEEPVDEAEELEELELEELEEAWVIPNCCD